MLRRFVRAWKSLLTFLYLSALLPGKKLSLRTAKKNFTFILFHRISECTAEIGETRRKREADLKELETMTKEMAEMSNAEKQRIIVQISSVQTELKRTMDER